MTKNKYKEGDIVQLKDGRFVYLHLKDNNADIYTALFYAPAFGIDCADWGMFDPDMVPEYQGAVKVDGDHQVPDEFMARVVEKRSKAAYDKRIQQMADYNEEELDRYDNISVKEKIEMLDDAANGEGWYYSTNKEREINCHQLVEKEAMNFYIEHLKKLKIA